MTRLIRNAILLGAFIVAWVLALSELFRRGGEPWSGIRRAAEHKPRRNTKRWAFKIVALLTLAALGGFLFAASGLMSIKASSGHWAITAWLLNFAMRRSVITHSLTIKSPPLDDRALVLKGAGHYEIGCRPCHGSPDLPQEPRIAQRMTPHPPNLSEEVPKWDASQLFYIVKHGVKFTGMPAWPAQRRDDEVWAMVAFLLALPTLNGDDYRRLAHDVPMPAGGNAPLEDLAGEQRAPAAVKESCARCHGADGRGRGLGAFPKLAGQKPAYFIATMQAYARGRRSSGIMEPIAAALARDATNELAHYYAKLESNGAVQKTPVGNVNRSELQQNSTEGPAASVKVASGKPPEAASNVELARHGSANDNATAAIERGRQIAVSGIPSQRVPPCSECHGPGGLPRNPHYPNLSGQYAEYLLLQLTLFKQQARGGTAYAHLMRPVASGLTPDQMHDVTHYYASLK